MTVDRLPLLHSLSYFAASFFFVFFFFFFLFGGRRGNEKEEKGKEFPIRRKRKTYTHFFAIFLSIQNKKILCVSSFIGALSSSFNWLSLDFIFACFVVIIIMTATTTTITIRAVITCGGKKKMLAVADQERWRRKSRALSLNARWRRRGSHQANRQTRRL